MAKNDDGELFFPISIIPNIGRQFHMNRPL